MFVTPSDKRGGILVASITGGRPETKQRPVGGFFPDLVPFGPAGVGWVLSDADAAVYETDDYEQMIYTRRWAEEYAAEHWMLPGLPEPGAFLGAFPGREAACREAERRGCWAVVQLDDNIFDLRMFRGSTAGKDLVRERGGLALYLDLLAAVALSTNARTVGAQLDAVNPTAKSSAKVARPGFPYSLFLEVVGEGREPWYGPFEDDITHSFQYGSRGDGVTAAVMPALHYKKESKSKTGMRKHYDHTRAVQLQRLFPQGADIAVRATHANGRGDARVFHQMRRGAIKNPLVVTDPELYGAVHARMNELVTDWWPREVAYNREKAHRRATA